MPVYQNADKKFVTFIIPVFILGLLLLSGCRHAPDAASLPKISFSGRILPIIQSNCGKSGCHEGGAEVFALRTYEEIRRRVVPKKPHQSGLYKNMIYLDANRVMPPPPDQPMSEQQLELIYTWIIQGAENN